MTILIVISEKRKTARNAGRNMIIIINNLHLCQCFLAHFPVNLCFTQLYGRNFMQFGSWKAGTDMVYYSHKRKVLSEKRVPEIRKG